MPSVEDGGIEQKGKKPSRRNCVRRNCNSKSNTFVHSVLRRRVKEGRWRVFGKMQLAPKWSQGTRQVRFSASQIEGQGQGFTNPRSPPKNCWGPTPSGGGWPANSGDILRPEGSRYLLDLKDRDVESPEIPSPKSRQIQPGPANGEGERMGWRRRRQHHDL